MTIPTRVLDAILQNQVPGEFNHDRMMFQFPVLESQKTSGAKIFWTIQVSLMDLSDHRNLAMTPDRIAEPPFNTAGVFLATSWQEGGQARKGTEPTYITSGKNIGRANATNQLTQAFREAWSKYNDKIRKGAKTMNETGKVTEEDIIFSNPPPMLVQKYGDTKKSLVDESDFASGVYVQRKFNGVRAVVRMNADADGVVIYSRTGVEYPGLNTLRKELEKIILQLPLLPEDMNSIPFLDGELYKHGMALREITGQARNSVDKDDLEFVIFDCFFPLAMDAGINYTFAERFEYLSSSWNSLDFKPTRVRLVETTSIPSLDHASLLSKKWVSEGYEGAIMRKGHGVYQFGTGGYHSPDLTKFKPLYDSEYMVVDYTQGVGKNAGAVVWVCEVPQAEALIPHDRQFNVVQKGITLDERKLIHACLGQQVMVDGKITSRFNRDFYGQMLTVEYPEKSTATGKPLQGRAIAFRNFANELGNNPLQKLFTECMSARMQDLNLNASANVGGTAH